MARLLAFFTHKFFKILLALYISIFSIIWLISSPVAKHFISPILAEKQLQLSDEASIRFNPFLMRVTLSDINLSSIRSNTPETVLKLTELKLQVALWQLVFDKVVLSKFTIEQGNLKVTQSEHGLIIAGIAIESDSKNESETSSEQDAEQATDELATTDNEPTSSVAYQLILPKLLLSQFHIEIEKQQQEDKSKTHHIEIEELVISQVKATQDEQAANLSLSALIDQTHLSLTADTQLISGEGDINSLLRIDNYPVEYLARYVEPLTELAGALSFSSQQTLSIAKQGVDLKVQDAKFKIDELLLGVAEQKVTLKSLVHNFKDIAVSVRDNNITHLAGHSNIKLNNAVVSQNKTNATIAAFEQLNLANISFVLDDEPSIDITDIVLDELIFSKKAALSDEAIEKATARINKLSAEDGIDISAKELVKLPPVMQLKQLTLNNLHIHQQSIAINSIIFDTLTGDVIIKENKDIANLIALEEEPESQQGDEVKAINELKDVEQQQVKQLEEKTEQGFTFSLNELRFLNENTLNFTDFSVEPIYQRTLFIDTFELGAISNAADKKQQQTPFSLIGRSNKYANFNLAGQLQPFAKLPSYHIQGDFKEFSLPAISSYMKDSTGLEVKTGQLNTALDVTLKGEELDGNVVVLLQALETGLVDSEEAGNLIDQGALPLNMALGMLKDGDGNVELDVPLSGSTSDPEFGMSSIVTLITKKAIMSATQDYLLTTFVPYANIVSIAITAGEFALKLRFDDLEYQEKQIEPNDSQSAYLKDFISLMQDKQDTRVTICAISTPADIGLSAGKTVTDKADIKRLLDVGEQREHAFKDYLIEEGKIESSRILLCKPQIDSDEGAKPRIAISV